MPGLSQLKKFSQNLLSIGDEVIIRSSRGEKPVRVKIPKDIADADDSEEFMLGIFAFDGFDFAAELSVAACYENVHFRVC